VKITKYEIISGKGRNIKIGLIADPHGQLYSKISTSLLKSLITLL